MKGWPGRKSDNSEVFRTSCLSNISPHFKQVQSQFTVPPFAGPPLTSCCFMLTTLTYTRAGWQMESVDTLNKFTKSPVDCSASSEKKCMKKIHKC